MLGIRLRPRAAREVLYNQTLPLLFYITDSHNLKQLMDTGLVLTTFKKNYLIKIYKLYLVKRASQKYPGWEVPR